MTADFSCSQDSVVSVESGDFYTAICSVSLTMDDGSSLDNFSAENAQSCVTVCDEDVSCGLAVFKKDGLDGSGQCTTYSQPATTDDYVKCDDVSCSSTAVDVYNFNQDGNCDGLSVTSPTVDNESDNGDDHCAVPTYTDDTPCVDGDITYYDGNFYEMQCNRAVDDSDQDISVYSASSTQDCLNGQDQSAVALSYDTGICVEFLSGPIYLTGTLPEGTVELDLLVKLDTSTVDGQTCPIVRY